MKLIDDSTLINEYWHFGCHSDDLRKEGDYLLQKIGGRDVVLYHDGKGVIAFDNRCPHRGTSFFAAPMGNSPAICSYHGWSYTFGRLVIPLEAELIPNCTKPQLNQYRTEWCGAFLFFAISPAVELVEQLGDELFELIESLSFDCRERKDLNQYIYECPWQVAVENALEPQHLPFVHAETLNKLDLINCQNRYWGANSGVYFDIGNKALQKKLGRLARYYDLGGMVHSGYMSIYLFPFGFISSTAGTTYSVQSFFPRENGGTWFAARLYAVRLSDPCHKAFDDALISAAKDMNRKVFEEDHAVCRRISYDSWRDSLMGPLYFSEEKIKAFRNHLSTGNSI